MTNARRAELGERHPAVMRHDQNLAWELVHAVNKMMKDLYGIYSPEAEKVRHCVRAWFQAHEGVHE